MDRLKYTSLFVVRKGGTYENDHDFTLDMAEQEMEPWQTKAKST